MMRTCKIKPRYSTCKHCVETAVQYDETPLCDICNSDTYELLKIGTSFWSGDYAFVKNKGKIEKVGLDRVYDIREKGDKYSESNLL